MSILRKTLTAAAGLAGAAASVFMTAAPPQAGATPAPPPVPSNIAVPAGNVLAGKTAAQGFQIYTCQPQGSGHAWTLLQPMAVLLDPGHKPAGMHFGGPTWMAMDGSSVVGARVDGAPAPTPGAIPWLLLKGTPSGGADGGRFVGTTFIQRVNTTGGVAPSTGCGAETVGSQTSVPYTADYFYFRAA